MQSAAEQQYQLGDKYYFGLGVTKDLKKAAEYYELAAKQGYATAQCTLGYCYKKGEGVAKDLNKAVEYYELAAKQGDKYAENALTKLQAISSTINANLIHTIVEEDPETLKESTQVAEQSAMCTAEGVQLQGRDSQPLLMTAQGGAMVSISHTFATPQQSHAEVSELPRGLQHLPLEVSRSKDVQVIQSDTLATHANVLPQAKKS